MLLGHAGLQLDADLQKTLLFLCSGGQNWDAKVQGPRQAGAAAQNGASPVASSEASAPAGERVATNGQASTSGREPGQGQPEGAPQKAQPAKQMSEEVQMPLMTLCCMVHGAGLLQTLLMCSPTLCLC